MRAKSHHRGARFNLLAGSIVGCVFCVDLSLLNFLSLVVPVLVVGKRAHHDEEGNYKHVSIGFRY
jgi:hypothetical protein